MDSSAPLSQHCVTCRCVRTNHALMSMCVSQVGYVRLASAETCWMLPTSHYVKVRPFSISQHHYWHLPHVGMTMQRLHFFYVPAHPAQLAQPDQMHTDASASKALL